MPAATAPDGTSPTLPSGRLSLISVGYEGGTLDDLVDGLVSSGAVGVADVRLTPVSRKPGLSKRALAARLSEARIGYRHYRVLGNPRDNRARFGDDQAAQARYRRQLARPEATSALTDLATWASTGPIAVLCVERDPESCHRRLAIDALGVATGAASGSGLSQPLVAAAPAGDGARIGSLLPAAAYPPASTA